jgi:hypothetical protein
MKIFVLLFIQCFASLSILAQADRWQQRVKYTMNVDMDVRTNKLTGTQKLEYTNNSPDTLSRVFYHLYFNAFQPNSMMDMRSRQLGKIVLGNDVNGNPVSDWDPRVTNRISKLNPDEIGYQKIVSLKMNGTVQKFQVKETILEVTLAKAILPRSKVVFDLEFEAQVPLQIRRSGRDNPSTGVRYSMSQWYPKMCEYDYEGWHPTPYVAREFYGVWGDYEVNITIDKSYIIGGTGYLQNPTQIGFGYEPAGSKVNRPAGEKLTWRFTAPNVHDFMWAADPHFKHLVRKTTGGKTINVFYNSDPAFLQQRFDTMRPSVREQYKNTFSNYVAFWDGQWAEIADAAVVVLPFIEKNFGEYPYDQYSFIHGGDGGMEYPMATLLSGPSLGTAFHEWMHSWYQGVLATNESLYAWMDEGFTTYAEALVTQYYRLQTDKPGSKSTVPDASSSLQVNSQPRSYASYFNLAMSGFEEPMTTHSDHYNTNYAYGTAAYSKGAVFMEQLGYIVGSQVRDRILLEYYRTWRFRHPNVNDFIRTAEKVSGMKLDWYREYWVNTTKTINYGIDSVWEQSGKTMVRLRNTGEVPMPIDLVVTTKNNKKEMHYIPMYLMFGRKPEESPSIQRVTHEDWKWTHPTYTLELPSRLADISTIEIDPTLRLADIKMGDNQLRF